ncbi:hypothetical protein L3Y34_019696 [Caenorhabditis briggsae]|uniref:Protein kinase domain-containing protein n=1 Tax=Caenorhabditis briggsae TaxID=6238 RepID=A0AAE9DNP7_CAEBR|nr:hypothetical protein L3Y34_019696 [Caenorhabditis briggsae]
MMRKQEEQAAGPIAPEAPENLDADVPEEHAQEAPEAPDAPAQDPEEQALEPEVPEDPELEVPDAPDAPVEVAPEADPMEEDEADPEHQQAAGPEEEEEEEEEEDEDDEEEEEEEEEDEEAPEDLDAPEAPEAVQAPLRQPIPPPRELAQYELLKVIGSGTFGTVFQAKQIYSEDIWAIKVVKKPSEGPESECLKREIKFLQKKYNSPFLCEMEEVFENTVKVYFVLEFMAGGDLFHWTSHGPLREKNVRFYMSELVLAVEFLHKEKYIHRDIKRENIFVHRSGHIKLADFGLVRRLQRGETLNNLCGTHLSPEMKQAPISYGLPADVWAVGVVMYELATGEVVHDNSQLKDPRTMKLRNVGRLRKPCKDLLKALLAEEPEERPKIRHVKRMEFFEGLNWRTVAEQVPPRIPTLADDNDLRYFPRDEKAKDPVDDSTDYIRVWDGGFIPRGY